VQILRQEHYQQQVPVSQYVKSVPKMQPALGGNLVARLHQNVCKTLLCAGVPRDSNSPLTGASYSGGLPGDEKRKMAAPEARNVAPMTSATAAAASEAAPALDAAAAPAATKTVKGPSLRQRLQVSVVCTICCQGFWLFLYMHSLLMFVRVRNACLKLVR